MSSQQVEEIIGRARFVYPSEQEIHILRGYPEETIEAIKTALEKCKNSIDELEKTGDPEGILPSFITALNDLMRLAEKLST